MLRQYLRTCCFILVLSMLCTFVSGCSWMGKTAGKTQAKMERGIEAAKEGYREGYEKEHARNDSGQ